MFSREDSWLLNKKHLIEPTSSMSKYGGKTIILARFMPIVRTFAPFVAGIGKMSYAPVRALQRDRRHRLGGDLPDGGYFFGQNKHVEEHFEIVLIAIVLISVLPMAIEMLLAWLRPGRKTS